MELIVKGRQIELTPALKDWVSKKVKKIERKLSSIHKIEVELDYYPGKPNQKNECEITLYADHVIFRSTSENEDMYVAVDKAIEKIERQIERYKGKAYASENKHNHNLKSVNPLPTVSKEKRSVVKRKKFDIREMALQQAIDQMEYLGHSFFIFINSETSTVSVIYERKDGNVGLIDTGIVVS
ncbi:MAG: ribosome-associated translation inhibitor RaiA [Actinobacteria bacterium]|nr:ribosome-associated translation inhibitor RaiA [Actinomycetota bacterium]